MIAPWMCARVVGSVKGEKSMMLMNCLYFRFGAQFVLFLFYLMKFSRVQAVEIGNLTQIGATSNRDLEAGKFHEAT